MQAKYIVDIPTVQPLSLTDRIAGKESCSRIDAVRDILSIFDTFFKSVQFEHKPEKCSVVFWRIFLK